MFMVHILTGRKAGLLETSAEKRKMKQIGGRENTIIRVNKLSWLLSFCSNCLIKGIVWSYTCKLKNELIRGQKLI